MYMETQTGLQKCFLHPICSLSVVLKRGQFIKPVFGGKATLTRGGGGIVHARIFMVRVFTQSEVSQQLCLRLLAFCFERF